MRPPFGDHDDRIRDICTAMNLTIVMWDHETDDWRSENPAFDAKTIVPAAAAKAKALSTSSKGVIGLQHDLYAKASALAPGIVDAIIANKMTPMSVAECVNNRTPYSNKNLVIPLSMKADTGSSSGNTTGTGSSKNTAGGNDKGAASTNSGFLVGAFAGIAALFV